MLSYATASSRVIWLQALHVWLTVQKQVPEGLPLSFVDGRVIITMSFPIVLVQLARYDRGCVKQGATNHQFSLVQ